jgi:hypothetical protein
MPSWGRRVRGAIGIGLTWALAWFGAGMVLLLIVGVGAADVPFPLFFGLLGFIAGVVFAGILAVRAGPRRLEQLSLARVSGWGALGGLLLAVGLVLVAGLGGGALLLGPVFAVAGAGCAASTLALARRATTHALTDGAPAAMIERGESGLPARRDDVV